MKIRAITMDAANMTVQQNNQRGRQQGQTGNNMFSPRYKVTISKEGRELSRQYSSRTVENTPSLREEKKLLRQQDQDELQKDIRQGYREELKSIEDEISALNRSVLDQDTLNKRTQDVIDVMDSQRDIQAEENERRLKEAQELAMQAAGYQEEVDENNRDLVMLLKTMEEAEKAEEERESGEISVEHKGGVLPDTDISESSLIKDSAVQLATSSLERESRVMDGYADRMKEGQQLIKTADQITQNVIAEGKNINASLEEDNYADAEIVESMNVYRNSMEINYKDVEDAREEGQLIMHDATIEKKVHLKNNPLGGLSATERSMMWIAADTAVNEAADNRLSEGSRDLAKEAQKLIDERNSLDRIQQNREEVKEEQEEEAKEEQEKGLSGSIQADDTQTETIQAESIWK
ncbi:MAG: hypothetical protein NC417_01325 [Candidatus Gastranaerophilales bacterium]|nr:hypothetical protein [Candidatus Gastranaerophilales bacterium]